MGEMSLRTKNVSQDGLPEKVCSPQNIIYRYRSIKLASIYIKYRYQLSLLIHARSKIEEGHPV